LVPSVYHGKVRDVYDLGDQLLMVTSDRISAFDRPLGEISGKGEVLNQLALFWFDHTADIVPNHVVKRCGPRSTLVKKAQMVPVEVVVRAYLTGSAWKAYREGNLIPGLVVPPGYRAHQKLDQPQITPTTKAAVGDHDEPLSGQDVVSRGLCSQELWSQIETVAQRLFLRGTEWAVQQGLLLVDTKYEFGLVNGQLTICDEIHTPDCSRFWFAADYDEAFSSGREPRKLDKEYLRSWLADQGFSGEGPVPTIPPKVFEETRKRYVDAYELLTGQAFQFSKLSFEAELASLPYLR